MYKELGVHKALITKKALSKLSHAYQVRFVCFCARQVEAQWKAIPEAVRAVELAEAWLKGEATVEECKEAADKAWSASNAADTAYAATATAAAAHAAAHAAYAARAAASAAANAAAYAAAYAAWAVEATADEKAKQKPTHAQWELYEELLHIDEVLERAIGI